MDYRIRNPDDNKTKNKVRVEEAKRIYKHDDNVPKRTTMQGGTQATHTKSQLQRRTLFAVFGLVCLFVLGGRWKRRGYEHEVMSSLVMACNNSCNGREKLYYQQKEKSDARWTNIQLENQSCTGRASFSIVYTVKPRIPESNNNYRIIFYRFWCFPLFVPVQLVRGAYAFPGNGNFPLIFYRFWGWRTICYGSVTTGVFPRKR